MEFCSCAYPGFFGCQGQSAGSASITGSHRVKDLARGFYTVGDLTRDLPINNPDPNPTVPYLYIF